MFSILTWLARQLFPGGQPAAGGQRMSVTLADGRQAAGYFVNGHFIEDQRAGQAFSDVRGADRRGEGGQAAGPFGTQVLVVGPPAGGGPRPPRRGLFSRIPRWVRWSAVVVILLAFFRRAVTWAVVTGLSAMLHLFGANVHLPHIAFGWPWTSVTSPTTQTVLVGPLVLQKIEGIDKPALGTANFNFTFTHSVSHSIGIWPCWYSATFDAVAHASATVDLNPGSGWWKPATRHYQLRVLRAPADGKPGAVAITMALPLPQLPQSVHDVAVDNTLSKPVASDHSWTYPGLGCGVLIRPQFTQSVLYAEAQQEAFYQATHLASVTRPLISTAEQEATTIIRDNFVTPTAGALGYTISSFAIRWVSTANP
jgi:hypothetical protein